MKKIRSLLLVPAAILAVACDRDDSSKKVDDALNADLTLAAQARPYMAMDSISAMERAYAAQQGYAPMPGYAPVGYAPVYREPAPVYREPAPVRRTSTARRSSGTRSSGTYSAPAPRQTRVVKHTKRDAIIGGVAGAAIGAVTSRDKVKGAVIGGVTGGILGAVIGNNVDVSRR